MKMITLTLYIMSAALLALSTAGQNTPTTSSMPDPEALAFKDGYENGKEMGLDGGSKGLGVPTPRALEVIADGRFQLAGSKGDAVQWKRGFKIGLQDGTAEAKRTNRPATANSGKYEQPSYWAGYKAGYDSADTQGDERIKMFRRCDALIAEKHFDKTSFNEGFIAGTAEADKQGDQKKAIQAASDKKAFEKESYDAGYKTAHEMHLNEGGDITRSIELGLRAENEAKQYDSKSWHAGFNAAREADTRP